MIEEMINNALDYYRGGNSYEESVKNQLNALEATGIATTFAVSNMESSLSNEIRSNTDAIQELRSDVQSAAVGMYNMGQGIRNDIQDMALGMRNELRNQTFDILISQQMLANSFTHGFNAVTNTLNISFDQLGNKIDVLSEEISSKLDQIHDILNNPRLTESRELYRQALTSYKKGFYEEALEDCLGAVEKNKTDFISWYLLGLIYLFGAGKFSNVINLDKAEEALVNAAKYIDPDIGISEDANKFASEVYFNLGLARLAKSNDYLLENKIEDSNAKLLESESASKKAYQLSKENLIACYEHAKELHFLGKDNESLKLLEELIHLEKNFAIKALNDKNFESLWTDIEKLIEKLKLDVCEKIRKNFNEFREKSFSELNEIIKIMLSDFQKSSLQNQNLEKLNDFALTQKDETIKIFNGKIERRYFRYKNIEQKDYFSVLNILNEQSVDFENMKTFVDGIVKITGRAIGQEREDLQKVEQKEREERKWKEEQERKRKQEEELRRQEAARKLKEEEDRKRKEAEEEERKRLEAKEERQWRRKRSILLLIFIGIQCGLILCNKYFEIPFIQYFEEDILDKDIQTLSIIAGLFSFIGLFFAGGTRLFGIFVLAGSTVLSLVLGHPVIGLINIASFVLLFAGKKHYSNFGAIGICAVLLVGYGIFSYMISDERQTNLLFKAIKKHDTGKVELCIKKGANVNARKGKSKSTPLLYAINLFSPYYIEGKEVYDKFFVKLKGGSYTEELCPGPLSFPDKASEIMDLLISAGADINATNKYGITPLMLLSYYLNMCHTVSDAVIFEYIKKILKMGVDVNAETVEHVTALDIQKHNYWYSPGDETSEIQYRKKLINLLISYGAKE